MVADVKQLVESNLELRKENIKLKQQLDDCNKSPSSNSILSNLIQQSNLSNNEMANIIHYVDELSKVEEKGSIHFKICRGVQRLLNCKGVSLWYTDKLLNQVRKQNSLEEIGLQSYLEPRCVSYGDESDINLLTEDYLCKEVYRLKDNEITDVTQFCVNNKLNESNIIYISLINGPVGELYGVMILEFDTTRNLFRNYLTVVKLLGRINAFVLFNNSYVKYYYEQNKINNNIIESLREEVLVDPMTKCKNRKGQELYCKELLGQDVDFTYVMLDIDNFKIVNDTFGHDAGDEVICFVAELFNKYCQRMEGQAFRLGGDEFAGISLASEARYVTDEMDNFLKDVSSKKFLLTKESSGEIVHYSITVSIGIAFNCTNLDEAYKGADKPLYQSKESGKNQYNTIDMKGE